MISKNTNVNSGLTSVDMQGAGARTGQKPDSNHFAQAMQNNNIHGNMAPRAKSSLPNGIPSEADIAQAVQHSSVKPGRLGAASVSPEILTAALTDQLNGTNKDPQLSAMRGALQSANLDTPKQNTKEPMLGIPLNRTSMTQGIALRPQGMALKDGELMGIPISVPDRAVQNIALNRNPPAARKTPKEAKGIDSSDIGSLAARYESGSEGISAIGYDRTGGTSYGKYQIASIPGSMAGFLSFLEREEPELASRLKEAGPTNTGSRKGAMPDVWREIAKESPERFEELQEKYIHESHYQPALDAVEKMGYKIKSKAMQEVLWSTAVQHGPAGAAKIYAQVASQVPSVAQENQERRIINEIYDLRATRFGSSTARIQELAKIRMENEKQIALSMVAKKQEIV